MSNLTEVINSINDESNLEEVKQQLLAEADALNDNGKRLYVRAKKAEGFEYNEDSKQWVKKEVKEQAQPIQGMKPEAQKSNEPDYARLAFLEQRKVTHPDDQRIVIEEAARLNLPLTDILSMEHIKGKLKDANDQREAESGVPRGTARRSGATKDSLEYWLAKDPNEPGSTPDDLELANKVIEARIAQQEQTSKFSQELYTG